MGGKVQAIPDSPITSLVIRGSATVRRLRRPASRCVLAGHHSGRDDLPAFDREKCIVAAAASGTAPNPLTARTNIEFRAGAGGFHSAEN